VYQIHQNWPSFVEDMAKNILAYFFLGHSVYVVFDFLVC